jgi:hypothetical protein
VTELGETNGNLIFDAVVDSAFLYAAGRTLGRLPGFQNKGKWDAIIVKIRLDNGEIIATDQWGAAGIDGYGNITLDDAGNLYLSGAGSLPGGAASGDNRYLVAKHNAETLENIWRALDPVLPTADKVTEAWGGITYIPGKTPGVGKLIIGGWFRPPGNPPKGADGFVSLYGDLDQASPRILAVHQMSSPGFKADWVLDNCADSEGNIYAVGYTTGDLDGKQQGEGDMVVIKLDPNLSNPRYVQWGTAWSDMFRKLVIDDQNHLYAIGYTYGDYAADNPDISRLTGDVVVQKFDTDLNRLAACQFGTPGEERGFLHVQDSILYIAGLTEGSLAGLNLGSFDGYVVALKSNDLSFTQIQTSVQQKDIAPNRLGQFSLHQNYPNPFNPVTTIVFDLKQKDHVSINVFNTSGQQVAQLFNRDTPPGRHKVSFDAHHLPGGVYFCRMQSPGNMQTIKLLLLK